MILTNRMYDALKWVTLILLPAASVLYMALSPLWNLPYPTQVAATIAAVDTFLAVLLGISTNTFKINNPMYRLNLIKLVGDLKNTWVMSTSAYDILTWIAQILLPALATLYGGLSIVWNLPYTDQIIGTILALDTFLGLVLGFSTAEFHKKVAQACVEAPEEWTNIPK
jgi:hypothetical protein